MIAAAGRLAVASGLDDDTLVREAADAAVVIVRAPLPPRLFAAAPGLRAAIRHGAGLDMIPVAAATEAGVPGVNARSVAEHVFMVTLALLRRFRKVDQDLRQGGWAAGRAHAEQTLELAGRTIGIVGMGAVGRAVAAIARHGFGLRVLGTNRSGSVLPEGVERATLEELAAESDVVVLCCPLTPETSGLVFIARMKPSAMLVNVARGAVVDEAALVAALRQGRLAGAALDVFATQPLPSDHPFLGFDNVILTPHMAGITEESMARMGKGAAAETLRVLAGGLPQNLVNRQAVAAYRRRFPAA